MAKSICYNQKMDQPVNQSETQSPGYVEVPKPLESPHKDFKPLIYSLILITSIFIIYKVLIFNINPVQRVEIKETPIKQPITPKRQEPPLLIQKEINVTGVLRYSGLSSEDEQRLGLEGVEYQLSETWDEDTNGYFLIPASGFSFLTELSGSVGKCLAVTGEIPLDWATKDKIDYYYRLGLNVSSIQLRDFSQCNPYQHYGKSENSKIDKTFTGTITKINRPAPDINYDYEIKLDNAYLDNMNASGRSQVVTSFVIMPSTNKIWQEIEESIGKAVKISGAFEWGYAESTYFNVAEISF